MYYKRLLTKFTAFVMTGLMTLANLSADVFQTRSEKQTSEMYACEEEVSSYAETVAPYAGAAGVMNQQSLDEARIDAIYNMAMAGNYSAASCEALRPEPTQMTSEEAIAAGFLTPQQFKEPGDADDTNAFKRMFEAACAKENSFTMEYEYKKCKAIFIPSGEYVITDTIIESNSSTVQTCAFEVFGAGRESTVIHFRGNGKVMFDDTTYNVGGPIPFAFTTFHDICFNSDNLSTFMNVKDNRSGTSGVEENPLSSNGVQRMQFISCSFLHWKTIINTVRSFHMLSEFTFAFCRIENCGTEKTNPKTNCELFILNDPESVNWRFICTDIEGIVGTVFHYKTGIGLCLIGGSVIIENGTAFDFDIYDEDDTAGQANSPHLHCMGTRFEIKAYQTKPADAHSTLLRTKTQFRDKPNVVFDTCTFSSASGDNQSWRFLDINGGANVLFENCYDLSGLSLTGDFSTGGLINPCLRFINCPSFSPERFLERCTNMKQAQNVQNECHVIVDDTYDFYVKVGSDGKGSYDNRTITGLHECRQDVKLTEYSTATMTNGKTFPYKKDFQTGVVTVTPVKPYGLVKYVELTVLKNEAYKNYSPITLTFYDKDKQIGEPVELSYTTTQTHMIVINDFVDELTFKVSHSNSTSPELSINMTVVKY